MKPLKDFSDGISCC